MPDHLISAIDELLDAETPFTRIEDMIEAMPIPGEQRSALWLYAWVETDRDQRRVTVEELLTATS